MIHIALVGGGEGICSGGGQVNVGPWGKSWLLSGGDGYTSYWEHYPPLTNHQTPCPLC